MAYVALAYGCKDWIKVTFGIWIRKIDRWIAEILAGQNFQGNSRIHVVFLKSLTECTEDYSRMLFELWTGYAVQTTAGMGTWFARGCFHIDTIPPSALRGKSRIVFLKSLTNCSSCDVNFSNACLFLVFIQINVTHLPLLTICTILHEPLLIKKFWSHFCTWYTTL